MRTSVPFAGACAAAPGATDASGSVEEGEASVAEDSVAEDSVAEDSVAEDCGAADGAPDWPFCSWKASAVSSKINCVCPWCCWVSDLSYSYSA